MKQLIRYAIVLIFLAGLILLARNPAVGASEPMSQANQSTLASVTGFVWNDADRDGVHDTNEKGIRNVTVRLYNSAKKLVNTAKTDANGRYQFADLTPGEYFVHILTPNHYAFTRKDQGGDEAVDSDADPATGETIVAPLVAGENLLKWDAGLFRSGIPPAQGPGTVKPPPSDVTICRDDFVSVGGVSTVEVNNLAPGYCIGAFLRNHAFALGRLPDGAGKFLAHITFVRVFHHGRLVHALPEEDGTTQICYAAPPDKDVQIYFYDFYGPRFGERSGQPSWEPLETTVENGLACAPAQTSGAYALIGK